MRVARVTVHAPIVSFRHPFFVTGRQPTFAFPPPSTIHGHCASALGTWPDPKTFWFGAHFTFGARGQDLEHQHLASAKGGKPSIETPDGLARPTTEISVQPVTRDFLFDATLVLYLPPELAAAFASPAFTVVLGRSQDLAEVVAIDDVMLERSPRARLEHTILPRAVRPCVRFGSTVLLSRHIGPPPEREASFAQYIALREPVFLGADDDARSFDRVDGISFEDLWVDPSVVDDEGFPRGVWIHRLVDD